MFNFIARYFSSIWSLMTAPFRLFWRLVVYFFPERDFTIMNTRHGDVYSFHQSSFWRFTKFCGKFGLVIWALWSTYIFAYHRPLLQKRTEQLEEAKTAHARQMNDLSVYLKKYNELARGLNVIDDKVLNSKKLSQAEKDSLIKKRLNTWGELDFLQARITNIFSDANYSPEFARMSELSIEYEMIRAENESLREQNNQMNETVRIVSEADSQIVELVSAMTKDNTNKLHDNLKKISGAIASLGLNENILVERANKFSSRFVGSAFNPLQMDGQLDPKYQKLADNLELWHGLARLNIMLPLGAPVSKVRITSGYGTRSDPFNGQSKKHKGIDFAGRIGTELFAIAPGRVISAGERIGYGKTVEIDHGLGFSTLYAHLSQIDVARGDWVRPGTIVGLGGSSGRSTGPHLHYEIRYNGVPFNPTKFVKE